MSKDDAMKAGVQLLSIVLFLADTGNGDKREMHVPDYIGWFIQPKSH